MAAFLSASTPSRNTSNKSTVSSPVSRKHLEFSDVSTSRSSDSKSRFEAYNRLQAAAVAFGEKLPIPEIVALGGQSDGKSSLLEALLGFRFNVREVEMGTRRPLILQMVHDSSALEPRCRFQEEDSGEYGSPIVMASTVADIIKSRTEAHLKMIKSAVSSKPIIMRAEYAHCPNLTIIDTPGFVLKAKKGEPEGTPDEILEMVKSLASPPHRILVFLQQSSVEWCSSLWLDAIREIDPTLRRTIIVVSKFDNRLKEFNDRWEVDRYLSASGYLGEGIHPFFVALPKDRTTVSNEEFRKQISHVDMEIVRHLRDGVKGGFDEEKFRPFIGFSRLREYLESELQRRYKDAAPATLALLEQRCTEITMELARMNSKIEATSDISHLRKSAMLHTASISAHVGALIDGAADPSPEQWGKTTEEERSESGIGTWPGVTIDIKPPNATLRLYGGAAFERVINEFRCAAFSIQCPAVSREKVANILLAHAGRGGRGVPEASAEIARTAARSWLAPLLDTACDRLAFVLSNLFHLSIERTRCHNTNYGDKSSEMEGYVGFLASLRRSYDGFVRGLSKQCKQLIRHHLDSVTSPYSLAFHDTEEAIRSVRHTTSVPRPFCLELADDSVILQLHEEQENVPPAQKTTPGKSGEPALMTVPETPSPERQSDHYTGVVKKETGTCGEVGAKKRQSRVVGLGGRYQEEAANPFRSLNAGNRFFAGDFGTCGNNAVSSTSVSLSPYSDICSLAAQHFARIREVLVERNVASTLNSGFLTPCRDRLVVDLGLDLFAVADERFMEMFVVPGAVEVMQEEKQSLQKRQKILQSCLNEFKTVAGLL